MRDNSEISELMDAIDLEAYLEREGVVFRPTMGSRGPQFNLRDCPVCGSSGWKVYINQETGLGNCFAGDHPPGKNFNKFSLMRALMGEGVQVPAVIEEARRIAKEFGWRRRRTTAVATTVNRGSPKLPESLEIPIHGKNLAYLANRGIDVGTARYFGLRFCLNGGFEYLLSDGMRRRQDYSRRIIIPVFDLDGKLVSFQGRDITGTAEKKYLFPPGFASTGAHLYNGHNVIGTTRVVVGEGAFDVMALKLALDQDPALRDVVAIGTFGKHLSFGTEDSQEAKFLRLKEQGVSEVTIMWDGEIPATDAAIEAGNRLRGLGFKVRIAMLPPDKDPNEAPAAVVRDAFYKARVLNAVSAVGLAIDRRKMNAAA